MRSSVVTSTIDAKFPDVGCLGAGGGTGDVDAEAVGTTVVFPNEEQLVGLVLGMPPAWPTPAASCGCVVGERDGRPGCRTRRQA